jgi:tetratricopeptide (TPR) repeat protein
MRWHGRLSPGLIAVLIAIITILIAIPVTVVTGYIPAAVIDHKPAWIAGLLVLLLVLGVLAVQSARLAAIEAEPAPVRAAPAPIVVGEIPRKPPSFVNRATIGRLAEAAGSGRAALLCAVTGLRGVGKTQVAAAYARSRIEVGWGLVGWVNAESSDVLLAGLAQVAEAAGVADPDGDSARSAQRLRDHLETRTDPGLLVFDNATDPDVLRKFLPATGRTHLVVTSTDRAFADWGVPVDVSVFTRPESVGYLAERTGLDDQIGADAVADQLGDLPLALAQAAAVIKRRHWTFAKYLIELGRVPVATLLGRVPGSDYPRPAAAALLLSVQAAEDADPSVLVGLLLRVVAALSPDGVRREYLNGLSSAAGEVDAALGLCEAGSLLTWSETGKAVIMHRLLARVLRERDTAAGCWRETLKAVLGLIEPLQFDEEEAWSRREEGAELAIQVEAIWDASAATGSTDLQLAGQLLRARSWVVRQLRAAADLTRASDIGHRVLTDCIRVLGEESPDTLMARNNLAYAYRAAGRLAEAISLYEKNLAERVRVLGEDHPDTLLSRNNLAYAYLTAGRLGEAIPLLEQTLADRVRVLGPDHPDTLSTRNNLAYAYRSAGRLGEAIPLHEQTLADRLRVLGPDHPDTLTAQSNLAHADRSAGRLGEAISLHEQTLADRLRVLGPDHPDTLTSRNNLAAAYRAAGRLDKTTPPA